MAKARRDYKAEYRKYQSSPEDKKNRAARNRARLLAIKQGKVSKGDGKDIDHRDGNPQNNSPSNVRVTSRKLNRGKYRVQKERRYNKYNRGR
mgnify:FL=1